MKRLPVLLAVVTALILVGFLAAFLLSGNDEEPAPPPPPPPPPPVEKPVEKDPDAVPDTVHFSPVDGGDPDEPAVDPDAYPWEVPDWWSTTEAKLRDTEMHWATQSWKMVDLLERASEETGLEMSVGKSLRSWANRTTFKLKRFDGSAWELLEGLAVRHNVQIALGEKGVVYHQRGRGPDDATFQAGLVQQTITHARERHAGKREEHATTARMLSQVLSPVGEGEPLRLRQALKPLGKAVRLPVYVDRALWDANPEIRFPDVKASLKEVLDVVVEPTGAVHDVTQRRIVLFVPTGER